MQQAVSNRSKLRNELLKSKSFGDKNAYNRQRNSCISLLKKQYYSN